MNVEIRPLIEEDARTSVKWRNDPEVFKFTGNTYDHVITLESELNWIRKVITNKNEYRCAILVDGVYVGNIYLTDISSESAVYHIFIGDKTYWGKGIAKKASELILNYAFNVLKLKTVKLKVRAKNKTAIALYRKLGFIEQSCDGDFYKMSISNHHEIDQPLVTIGSITYNHAPYIRECLDSLLSQQTNFPFEIVVNDDCSTDGTTEIVREYAEKYPKIIKPIYHEENQYTKGVRGMFEHFVIPTARGKYIAICEGDDYWNDPLKLQKQVDYLESHPDVGMVYSDFNILNQKSGKIYPSRFKYSPKKFKSRYSSPEEFVLLKGYVAPPSWVFRRANLTQDLVSSLDGTFVKFTHFLVTTKVHVFDEAMVTYRILEESASHSKNYEKIYRRAVDLLETQLKLIERYNLNRQIIDKCLITHYNAILPLAIQLRKTRDIETARLLLKPYSIRNRILFIINDLCPSLIEYMRNIRKRLKRE